MGYKLNGELAARFLETKNDDGDTESPEQKRMAMLGQVKTAIDEMGRTAVDFRNRFEERLQAVETKQARTVSAGGPPEPKGGEVKGADVALFTGIMSVKGYETERKAMSNAGAGAALVPEEYRGAVWAHLTAEAQALQSGMTVIETTRDTLHIPRSTADATAAWTNEAAAITASDPTYSEVVATPRKLAALVTLSNEIIADGDPLVLREVQTSLLRTMALKMDSGIFEGSGTAPEIRGLKNVTGIQTVSMGVNGSAMVSLDPFADALGALAEKNATGSAIVMHPRTWKALTKIKEVSGSTKPLLQEEAGGPTVGVRRSIYGVPVYLSSQLSIAEVQGTSSNASSAYVYEARQGIVVRRSEIRVELDRSRLFNTDQSEIRAIARVDFVVPNPDAVVRIAGIIP